MSDVFNPIRYVTPVDVDGGVIGEKQENMITPSSYKVSIVDVSQSDAGRLESLKMIKGKLGQGIRIDLEFSYPSIEECSYILNLFDPEYLKIEYLDPKAGAFIEKIFYVGDRSAPLWNAKRGRWTSVSFAIIEQIS